VRRQAFLLLIAASVAATASLLLVGGAAAEPPALTSKKAQADAILAQVHQIDSQLEHVVEAYNLANIRLDRIRGQQAQNGVRLTVARKSLVRAQQLLAERLVAIYTSGGSGGAVDVLLGATSIEDLLDRLDTVERVSSQDADVLRQVTSFRDQVKAREAQLAKAKAAQQRIVAERAAQQRTVEAKLRERQSLLASIRSEIQQIQERERVRQLALARQARARLAQQSANSPSPTQSPGVAVAAVSADVPEARYGGVVGIAMRFLGVPYRWGGASPSGFDCSGFVMYVYAQVGVSLPHNAAAQYSYGTAVSRDALAPGDLVFFNGLGHNGIYIGGGQFIHSPHTGDVVKISSLSDSWYAATWVGARRL
jgi:peptidoglycan DL-endopeptidase CwlO